MTRDELRNPQVMAKIGELRSAEMTWGGIKDAILAEFNIDVNTEALKGAYDIFAARTAEIIAGDEELKGVLKKSVVKASDTLGMIHNRVSDMLLRSEHEENVLGAARELMRLIELQYKLLNNFKEGFSIDKINRIEYIKVSRDNLDELAKAGYIKILRRPGQPYDPNLKEVIELRHSHMSELKRLGEAHTDCYKLVLKDKDIKDAEVVSETIKGGNEENGRTS